MPWQKTKAEVKFPLRTLCALPRHLFLRSNINLVPRARKCWLWVRHCSNIRWITEAGSLGFLDQGIESCVNWRTRSQTKIRGEGQNSLSQIIYTSQVIQTRLQGQEPLGKNRNTNKNICSLQHPCLSFQHIKLYLTYDRPRSDLVPLEQRAGFFARVLGTDNQSECSHSLL